MQTAVGIASGYYDWRDRPPSISTQEHAILADKIKTIFDEEHAHAGAKRIAKRLNLEGIKVGRHCVARIMRTSGWRAKASKKFKATTNSNHKLLVAANLLQQNFSASRPNEKWVSDHGEKFSTRADAKNHVFEYIDAYYNRKRLHSRLGYLSPVYFESQKIA